MSTYNKIFTDNQYNLKYAVKRSEDWFKQQIVLLRQQRIGAYYLMRSNAEQNRSAITPGEMYMFYYDAKLKDELPYWDKFPLVFPFRALDDGFIGLNMHYLPYRMRIVLLDQLSVFRNTARFNEDTRLKLSWELIQGLSKLNLAKPCVHRYLASHIKSPLKKVDAPDWTTALMLPVEQFTGASKQRVWTDSMR